MIGGNGEAGMAMIGLVFKSFWGISGELIGRFGWGFLVWQGDSARF